MSGRRTRINTQEREVGETAFLSVANRFAWRICEFSGETAFVEGEAARRAFGMQQAPSVRMGYDSYYMLLYHKGFG
jgi:hypothetical protein